MLQQVHRESESVRDDQQMFVRYALSNPHLVAVDRQQRLFRTAYHEFTDLRQLDVTLDVSFKAHDRPPEDDHEVRLLHFNNKASNGLYAGYEHDDDGHVDDHDGS